MRDGPAIGPSGRQFEIACGEQRAVVVEVGGGLRAYSLNGRNLLDGYGPDEMCSAGRGQVLIPWPNRVQDGRYEFAGQRHQLTLSEPEQQNAIHGLVRWGAWSVAEHEPDRIVLEHVLHPQPGYPFSLSLSIDYLLSEEGLRVTTKATNSGSERCPFGSGAHPYLTVGTARVDDTILHAPAHTVLRADERGIPIGLESVEDTEFDFRRPRRIGSTRLDHCFTDLGRGADGLARVELRDPHGEIALTLWVDANYPYLMLFSGDPLSEVDRRSLAVEPMTCPPNAFHTREALITLEPGMSQISEWGISPRLKPGS